MTSGLVVLIAAALLDVYTTYRGVQLPNVEERNPVARWLLGAKPTVVPMLIGKALAVGVVIWIDPPLIGYLFVAAIWLAVSINNLVIIRRVETP